MIRILFATALALSLGAANTVMAGYNLYPPESINGYIMFDDSENARSATHCQGQTTRDICVIGSFLPRGYTVATAPNGHTPMISQGLFFSPVSFWKSTVVYNVTMEADLGRASDGTGLDDAVDKFRERLAAKYSVRKENVLISPLTVGSVQFIARNVYGSDATPSPGDPAPTPVPTPAPTLTPEELKNKAIKNAQTTTYTQIITPTWLGNVHSIGSRFSISIRGPVWDLEPGLQNMFLSAAGNATVGQVSFELPVKATAYRAKYECQLKDYQEYVRTTAKSWYYSRTWTPWGGTKEVFSNDERNGVRASVDMNLFCKIYSFEDTTLPEAQVMKDRAAQLFDMLFNKAFQKVVDSSVPTPVGGSDPKYTYFETRAISDVNAKVILDLNQEYVFNLGSDLDFYAGGITKDNLSPSHKYLCERFEGYDRTAEKCVLKCIPGMEVYMPSHERADRNSGCVDVTKEPLFTRRPA